MTKLSEAMDLQRHETAERLVKRENAQRFRVRAAFMVNGKWTWYVWTCTETSKHAAVYAKAQALNAERCDYGQADYGRLGETNY